MKYNFNHYFMNPVQNHFFDFEGRATRKEFWMYVLFNIITSIVISVVASLILNRVLNHAISTLYSLVLFFPSIGIGARRLHDIGRSGWWQLIGIIPVIGWIVLIVFFCTDSGHENEYGHKKHTA